MRTLPVKLTDDEVAIRSQELAESELLRVERSVALATAAEAWKEEKKSLENAEGAAVAECVRLSRVVKYREEPREVKCRLEVSNGQCRVIRTDTGEIVMERAATAHELQMTIEEATNETIDARIEKAISLPEEPEPLTEEDEGGAVPHPDPEQ